MQGPISRPGSDAGPWESPDLDQHHRDRGLPVDRPIEQIIRLLAEATSAPLAAYVVAEEDDWQHVAGDLGSPGVRDRVEPLWRRTLSSDEVVVIKRLVQSQPPGDPPPRGSINFYAGVATRDPEGHRVGLVWVGDAAPRDAPELECSLLLSARAAVEELISLRQQARVDALTGLLNRRAMDEHLEREWGRAVRLARPLSVLAVDVDHFKRFNDTFGHGEGDEALRTVADQMRRTLQRPTDLLARVGGEEFLVCLPDTDTQGACVIAEALRRSVERRYAPLRDAFVPELSVSVGVATVLDPSTRSEALEDLLRADDRAMYEAKTAGRNRVAISRTHHSALVGHH